MAAKVGLTGGIGSGKSTAGKLFRDEGITVIDADQVARQVTVPGSRGLARIVERFGVAVVRDDGSLDRRALAERVFSDPSARRWLEGELHPVIRDEMNAQAESCEDRWCILEIPLLVESGRYREMDRNIVVQSGKEIRMQRLLDSRDIGRETIERIMSTQATDEQRLAVADYVIDNDGSFQSLATQVSVVTGKLNLAFNQVDDCR